MKVNVGGVALTDAEWAAAVAVQDFLRLYGGDSVTEPNCSPAGDGRWVPLLEIFPRSGGNRSNASRQAVRRLHAKGVLAGFEVAFHGDCVKAVCGYRVAETERMATRC